jgi:hypothetical protein
MAGVTSCLLICVEKLLQANEPESMDVRKFASVESRHAVPVRQRGGCDEEIVRTDDGPSTRKISPGLRVAPSRLQAEWQYRNDVDNGLDECCAPRPDTGVICPVVPVQQLGGRDRCHCNWLVAERIKECRKA